MTRIKKDYRGRHTNRFEREPMERKFAYAWQRHNIVGRRPDTVDHLANQNIMSCSPMSAPPNERIAINTTIQWLGSPVGFAWLMDTLGLKDVRNTADLADLKKVWSKHRRRPVL